MFLKKQRGKIALCSIWNQIIASVRADETILWLKKCFTTRNKGDKTINVVKLLEFKKKEYKNTVNYNC